MRRRSIVPFFVGSKKVANLADLKNILLENPGALIEPLKDGRLMRFLTGLGDRYIDCLKYDTPEESLKALAKELGFELKEKLDLEESNTVASSSDEILKLLRSDKEEIHLSVGNFFLEELVINRKVKIIGQGKNSTVLKTDVFKVLSDDVILENLTLETHRFLPVKKPSFSSVHFSFGTSISEDLNIAIGIDIKQEGDLLRIISKNLEIEISEEIKKSNCKMYFENVTFRISPASNISFSNCVCDFINCSFISKSSKVIEFRNTAANIRKTSFAPNMELHLNNCENFLIEDCLFYGGDSAKIKVFSSKIFVKSSKFIEEFKGILVENSELKSSDSEFSECKLGIYGTGKSSIVVRCCEFRQNNKGIVAKDKTRLQVYNSTFKENWRGIEIENEAYFEIVKSRFKKHWHKERVLLVFEDRWGWGIIIKDKANGRIDGCYFSENYEDIWDYSQGSLYITKSNCGSRVTTANAVISDSSFSYLQISSSTVRKSNIYHLVVCYNNNSIVGSQIFEVEIWERAGVEIRDSEIDRIYYNSMKTERPILKNTTVGEWYDKAYDDDDDDWDDDDD